MESVLLGTSNFAISVDPDVAGRKLGDDVKRMKMRLLKRSAPYYIIGAVAGVAGIMMLARKEEDSGGTG